MRLRTLPVGLAGVMAGLACALFFGHFRVLPLIVCALFALGAQISSNFANEYYDFKSGIDKKGREGFRRGVTEGDISPRAMKRATYLLLAITCLVGCTLIIWGGWQLIFVGLFIAIFALAYSAGPFPLSRRGLGDVAVVLFYGIVPVVFTCYVICGEMIYLRLLVPLGFAIGLLADNVLIINNYRDYEDDKEAGKLTTVVIFGRPVMKIIYFLNFTMALAAVALFTALFRNPLWIISWGVIEIFYIFVWLKIGSRTGASLNPLLKYTALLMLLTCGVMITAAAT